MSAARGRTGPGEDRPCPLQSDRARPVTAPEEPGRYSGRALGERNPITDRKLRGGLVGCLPPAVLVTLADGRLQRAEMCIEAADGVSPTMTWSWTTALLP